MQQIQSRLSAKEVARTGVLSKSWLHAWSTIPTLRFRVHERKHLEVVERTLSRYLRDNIPIEWFDLNIYTMNLEFASLAEKWIRSVATCKSTSSLKEFSIRVSLRGASLTVPDEILSIGKSLTNLRVSALRNSSHSVWMKTPPINGIINCVSLREVVLSGVHVSQEVLDAMFSSCSLLENIELLLHEVEEEELLTIKIKNLARLHKIIIYSREGDSTDLEISGVPNLWVFRCDLIFGWRGRQGVRPFNAYSISLGSSVTELSLGGLITDKSSLEMIKSGFPFLESLSLDLSCWTLEIFHFTGALLKTLSLMWAPRDKLIDVKVNAPKLISFLFRGYSLPSLSFPVSTHLAQTVFDLLLNMPVDASFFLKMREALALSSKCCNVFIQAYKRQLASDIDLDDLRRRLPFPPANNVQQMEFQSIGDKDDEGRSPFLDAFLEICLP